MNKFIRSISALAATALVSGALTTALASVASAAGAPPWEPDANSAGSLVFYNAAGQQITGGTLSSAPFAAYVQGTATLRSGDTKATIYGYLPVNGETPGQWSGEAISASTTFPNGSAPGALASSTLPVVSGTSNDESLATLAADFPNTDSSSDGYAGLYQLRLKTSASGLSQTSKYDSVDIQITGSTWSVVYPAVTLTPTTTVLTTTPTSPQYAGTSVTLTATITPAAPGSVQFEVGGTDIGSPVTVSAGQASLLTSSLPQGTDSLSAVFTPATFSIYSGSTGTASFTVQKPPAAGTTTALSVNPSSAAADTAVTITAAVTQTSNSAALTSGTGQVAIYDDGTDSSGDITSNSVLLGTVAVGAGGLASLPYDSFATGSHNLVALFTPTDNTVYVTSTSLPVLFTATAPLIAPAPQSLDVSIPAGTLVITTPYSAQSPFSLGTAALNPADAEFVASAPFGSSSNPSQGVTITDTRAGDLPWAASVTVTNFSNGNGGVINGQNLSFTSVAASYVAGNALQSGDVTTTDVTSAGDYASNATGSDGLLNGPHVFASTTAGDGSVYIDGILTLVAPSSTQAGNYTATLTFTVS
jgi:hypothetical protein